MTRRMLIDAAHEEETRVVVMEGNRVVDYDAEIANKRPLKGNIYLAKVTRVEPSLQAAFVEYGGNRHGFLAFNEIHPDYYKIPVADREALIAEEAETLEDEGSENSASVETMGGDDLEHVERQRVSIQRRYKIQEVIKRRQILLVQVVKEERGTKGAALTTYLSLPGRYCVLMPNTSRGGGISRKITNARDRKRLKTIIDGLNIDAGMAIILRTAGSERSKVEIKRDYDYLIRLWNDIRDLTLASTAPSLIYEEGNLIKRTIRDLYAKEIEEILVDGDSGYKTAKDFMKTLIPSHAKKVKKYAKDGVPIFQEYKAENLLETIHSPTVQLRSGGYIVIHQTEALVAIDVNSGRATRERHIEETALKTNSEAAEEIARQLKLRDLAGLIVIDFIDMEDNRNNFSVERRFKEALKNDRARIQIGRISPFGLLEMSRQRLRSSVIEITGDPCPHCNGTGYIQSTDWMALQVLRAVEDEAARQNASEIELSVSSEVALYLLNQKRQLLSELENRNSLRVIIQTNGNTQGGSWEIEVIKRANSETDKPVDSKSSPAENEKGEESGKRRRRGRRRRSAQIEDSPISPNQTSSDDNTDKTDGEGASHMNNEERTEDGEPIKRRRRRGRRGGRRRNRITGEQIESGDGEDGQTAVDPDAAEQEHISEIAQDNSKSADEAETTEKKLDEQSKPRRPRRRRAPKAAKESTDFVEPDGSIADNAAAQTENNDNTNESTEVKSKVSDDLLDVDVSMTPSNSSHEMIPEKKSDVSDEETPVSTKPPRRGWWQRVVS
ncbi:MAG: ribonuclease E/G [Rickettsiales bacterium]|nr:ribonuclease E/G [Rickettsiales bacterium]